MATADDLLRVARSQLGERERPDGWTRYGAAYHLRHKKNGFSTAAWCDMFLGWCAAQISPHALKIVGDFALTTVHAAWFQDAGRWGQRPRRGAIVFFDWGGSHRISAIDHVGIVEAIRADGAIVTIEGNTRNAVRRRVRRTGIAGYGYPRYDTPKRKPKAKTTTRKQERDDVAIIVSLGAPGTQSVAAQTSTSLQLTTTYSDKRGLHPADGYSIITADPYWAIADALVTLTGVPAGEAIDLAWSRMTKQGEDWTVKDDAWRCTYRADGTGTINAQLGGQLALDKTVRLRLRIYNPTPAALTVTKALAKITLLRY
jgi:hypothetical protein